MLIEALARLYRLFMWGKFNFKKNLIFYRKTRLNVRDLTVTGEIFQIFVAFPEYFDFKNFTKFVFTSMIVIGF